MGNNGDSDWINEEKSATYNFTGKCKEVLFNWQHDNEGLVQQMSIKNEKVTYYHSKDNKRSHQSQTLPGDLGDFDSDPPEEIRVTALKAPLPLLGLPRWCDILLYVFQMAERRTRWASADLLQTQIWTPLDGAAAWCVCWRTAWLTRGHAVHAVCAHV